MSEHLVCNFHEGEIRRFLVVSAGVVVTEAPKAPESLARRRRENYFGSGRGKDAGEVCPAFRVVPHSLLVSCSRGPGDLGYPGFCRFAQKRIMLDSSL